jgi:hypothetical protein
MYVGLQELFRSRLLRVKEPVVAQRLATEPWTVKHVKNTAFFSGGDPPGVTTQTQPLKAFNVGNLREISGAAGSQTLAVAWPIWWT